MFDFKFFPIFPRFVGLQPQILLLLLAFAFAQPALAESSQNGPLRIVVLGDSLVAGFGLAPGEDFPARLAARMQAAGHTVELVNAGVSGDTSAAGLARLEWAVSGDVDGVILELGANDALRGIDPVSTRANLNEMITRLRARGIPVLLAGMLAPPNLGSQYANEFNAIYPDLARIHSISLYPFFLEGVAAQPELNQDDGIHPNARGIEVMVEEFLPYAQAFLARIAGN